MAVIHSRTPLSSAPHDIVEKKVDFKTSFGSGLITGLKGEYKCLFPERIIFSWFQQQLLYILNTGTKYNPRQKNTLS